MGPKIAGAPLATVTFSASIVSTSIPTSPAEYAPGQRSRVVGLVDLPGRRFACSLFDGDAIWIVELWETKAAHAASLGLPAVKEAIKKGRPLIAGFGTRAEFKPVGRS